MLIPVIVTLAMSAENVSDVDLAHTPAVERVAHRPRQLLQIHMIDAVADLLIAGEADRASGRAGSRMPQSGAAVSMITATPALSSPPRSVVPSVVMIVLPRSLASSGLSAGQHLARVARQDDVLAIVAGMDNGLDPDATCFRRGVHMGDPGDDRRGPLDRARGWSP